MSEIEISHEGVVQSAGADSITVMLSPGISCSGCQAEKSCGISGNDRKMVTVEGSYLLAPGDKVIVSMKKSQGFTALFLGYFLPLILVVITLSVLVSLRLDELTAGLISVLVLLPYYGIMYLTRRMINSRFSFTLKRIE